MWRKLILLLIPALLTAVLPCLGDTVYILTAPYFTVEDGVSFEALTDGSYRIVYTAETAAAFPEIPGEILSDDELLTATWNEPGTRAIVPFERMLPRWKMLRVDGTCPFDFGFDPDAYALTRPGEDNFFPERLTSLTLTGTTAMSRNLAYHMEDEGLLMPAENIGAVLAASDLTHISNEASFSPDCPPGVPLRREARFCSAPSYFGLLQAVGADVVELTGNHNLDWGYDPFLYSLDLYEEAGIPVYGGGLTAADAQQPLLIEHNGNKLAFLGCNAIGPENVWATESTPGAARCAPDLMKAQIAELKADGWNPVVTFQHLEYTWYDVPALQSHDFYEIARDAQPAIISGSQAHIPQGFDFSGDTFIHFGLGNLFFDQMSDVERTSFFDRHYFYENRYLGNQLETIILENYSQPRFLTQEEREAFLSLIFSCSPGNKELSHE